MIGGLKDMEDFDRVSKSIRFFEKHPKKHKIDFNFSCDRCDLTCFPARFLDVWRQG